MFDIKWIRENAEAFDAGLKNRGLEPASAKLLELDEARRRHLTKLQDAQSRRNAASKEIGKAKGAKDEALASKLMAEVAELKEVIQSGEEEERKLIHALEEALSVIPNTPREDVPVGADETDNVEVRRVGAPPKFDFTPKQHFEIGEALGLMDFETAGKVSGARFVYLKGALARLERALASFMLDLQTDTFGYSETNPPLLVRDEAAFGTGNLPKFAEDLFPTSRRNIDIEKLATDAASIFLPPNLGADWREWAMARDEMLDKFKELFPKEHLWLIPTAEVPLTNMVREQILDEDALPMRLTA
ncbi:MAG TPA: serine--tRNA ligase, partial [Hyphomicrobium sp.]|nr:serine--tRNA ligase [Hyphomicrobium sp.]